MFVCGGVCYELVVFYVQFPCRLSLYFSLTVYLLLVCHGVVFSYVCYLSLCSVIFYRAFSLEISGMSRPRL